MIGTFEELLAAAKAVQKKRVVVIFPNNEETFSAIIRAHEEGLASFILAGERDAIATRLAAAGIPDGTMRVVAAASPAEALNRAVEVIRAGEGDILLKGGIDTPTMMKGVLREEAGIR